MATGEVYSWPEGAVYVYTGAGGASALVAYATETTVSEMRGAANFQTLDGVYHNVPTGRIIYVDIGALYCTDFKLLQAMASAETAVHMHLSHTTTYGSAGQRLYSGYIDSLEIAGRERDVYRARLSYHANIWSAY